MPKATPIDIKASFEKLTELKGCNPNSSERDGFVATLSDYRNGGVFIAYFGGASEWERHPNGDELVMVVEGETDLFLLVDGTEVRTSLREGELVVVPENTWHRFETPSVKILTVTPQPTDHRSERPE